MGEIRSRLARAAAETALVRLVRHYGSTPEFVVLGGLVPDLLCSTSPYIHVGTTDVDVQVDLEIQAGSTNAPKLEGALMRAGFEVDSNKSWRWLSDGPNRIVIKFELLADLDDHPAESSVLFDDCARLGAVNLRGTGFAAGNFELRTFSGVVDGTPVDVQVRVASLAGYLLAKIHAARSRRPRRISTTLRLCCYITISVASRSPLIGSDTHFPTSPSAQRSLLSTSCRRTSQISTTKGHVHTPTRW